LRYILRDRVPFSIFLFVFSVGIDRSCVLNISRTDRIITWMCQLFHVKLCFASGWTTRLARSLTIRNVILVQSKLLSVLHIVSCSDLYTLFVPLHTDPSTTYEKFLCRRISCCLLNVMFFSDCPNTSRLCSPCRLDMTRPT